ncbi:MAG: hypothetical protein DSY98_07585, partial [SAR324 cluster bacterium]
YIVYIVYILYILDNIELKCLIFKNQILRFFDRIIFELPKIGGLRSHTGDCVAFLLKSRERTSHDA